MKKTPSEQETRAKILKTARQYNCEGDILKIFSKYDALLANCTNPQERSAIATMGIMEIHNFFGGYGTLEVNHVVVQEEKKIVK